RAVGVLVAEASLIARGLQDLETAKVGFELVSHHHADTGADALAHLGANAEQADRPVLGNGEEDPWIVLQAAGHAVAAELLLLCSGRGRKLDGKDEGSGRESEENRAAREIRDCSRAGHDQALPAARLMASRMRG